MAEQIFVLTGPTASGKTQVGALLAQAISGEVVSADSMQIYKGLDIGTAKPRAEEMLSVPHHMLDFVDPGDSFSVAQYVAMAEEKIQEIFARGKVPIIVGGTGLYLEALVRGTAFAPTPSDPSVRQALETELYQLGGEEMLARLREVDPETGARLFPNDHKRIVRALEIYQLTGKAKSAFDRETLAVPPRYQACYLALAFREREWQRQRIAQRVDQMMAQGLLQEVEAYLHLPDQCNAMQAIGYKELRPVLTQGADLAEAVALLKIRSQQYAKRQLTWIRNKSAVTWHYWEKIPNISDALQVSTEIWQEFRYNS